MSLYIKLDNIDIPSGKLFKVFYTSGRTPGGDEYQTTWGTQYGGLYTGGTTSEIDIDFLSIDSNPYGKQYWFKLQYTGDTHVGYILENIYIHNQTFYQDCLNCSTPTPTPTISASPTPTVTPTFTSTPATTSPETPSPTPTNSATPTETSTNTPTPTVTPTLSPTPTSVDTIQAEYDVNAYSDNIRYEIGFSNAACLYSGSCGLGNEITFTDISGCSTGCTGNTIMNTSTGDFEITWSKTRNQTGTCTVGPCLAEEPTTVEIYINGSEATSFGSPFTYAGPLPGPAQSVTGNVILTGITTSDIIKIVIYEQ